MKKLHGFFSKQNFLNIILITFKPLQIVFEKNNNIMQRNICCVFTYQLPLRNLIFKL